MPAKKSHAHTIRTLEENIGKTFSNINRSHVFLSQFPKAKEVKAKARKWELMKLKKLLRGKGNHQQNRKITYGIRENICK